MEHLKQFYIELGAFIQTEPFGVVAEFEMKGGQEHFTFTFRVSQKPPQRLSILAGECVHHLRSILDNIIWELACTAYSPRPPPEKISFPLFHTPFKTTVEYNEAIAKDSRFKGINGFPPAARALIEDLQPYSGAYANTPNAHPLSTLDRLWNDDKHRIPTELLILAGRIDMKGWPTVVPIPDTLEDGTILLRGIVPNPKPHENPEVSYHIALGVDRQPANKLWANYYLGNLHKFVQDEVVAKFEPILMGGKP